MDSDLGYIAVYCITSLIISSIIAENIGKKKEIGFTGTFILGILLSPVAALIAALISPPINKQTNISGQRTTPPSYNSPVADELRKLSELQQQGIITEQEYQRLKNRLIN